MAQLGTPHLTQIHNAGIHESESGMAHFAGTGPANATCRECSAWCRSSAFKRGKDGALLPRQCQKFTHMTGAHGDAVSHNIRACKYFVGSKRAPKVERRERKAK